MINKKEKHHVKEQSIKILEVSEHARKIKEQERERERIRSRERIKRERQTSRFTSGSLEIH